MLADIERLSPTQAYTALTNAAPPEALVAAEHRSLERHAEQSLPDAEPDAILVAPGTDATTLTQPSARTTTAPALAGDTTVAKSALTDGYCPSEWFRTASFKDKSGVSRLMCPNPTFAGDYQWCLLDWWGGAYTKSSNTDRTFGTVCADIGNVTLKVSTVDHGGGTWSVPQGSYRWFYSGYTTCGLAHWCDFSARYDITNATNSRFNFGGTFTHAD
jgi:hypothetical protein